MPAAPARAAEPWSMSKILPSREHEQEKNAQSLNRLAVLGGAVVLAVLAAILLFTFLR